MDGEKGFMLKKDKIEWKEREKNFLSVKQETIEKRTGVVEIRSHQVFQTEEEAIDKFNKLQNPATKVTSKKQANKDLKEKLEKLKKNHSIINGEEMNVTEMKGSDLEKSMMEDDLGAEKAHYAEVLKQKKEQEAAVKEAKLEELKEKYKSDPEADPEAYQYFRAELLDDEELIEEQREIYEEMTAAITTIKQSVDVKLRKLEIERYRRGFKGATNIRRLIFDRFFMKEYREIKNTKENTGSLEAEDSLADVLSNKMGMIQNKNYELYLQALKRLYDTEVSRSKDAHIESLRKAEQRKEKAKNQDLQTLQKAEEEYEKIRKESYSRPVNEIMQAAKYQDFLNAWKKGISAENFWRSLMTKSK